MSSNSDLAPQIRGTGAHLHTAELLAFTRFFDSARLIEEVLAKHLDEWHDMTLREYEVLVRLDGDGDELRLTELATRCVFPNSELTQTLVRLEDRGWIVREKAIGDGRGVLTRLLPDGADALAAAAPVHADLIRDRLLSCWSKADIETISRAMEASATRLRELRQ